MTFFGSRRSLVGGPPAPRFRRSRRVARIGVAIVTAVTVATSTTGQAAEAVVDQMKLATADGEWKPAKEVSVNGTNAKVIPRKADPAQKQAITAAPAIRWPEPGTATVALPTLTRAGADWTTPLRGSLPKSTGLGRITTQATTAGELPIAVGPTAAAVRAVSADERAVSAAEQRAAADTPKSVEVDLVGRRGDSVVFGLRRADGLRKAGPISVRFDYSAFKHAYGGDWNSRLRIVALPDCVLGKAKCTADPVATSNDGSGTLTADVAPGPERSLFAVQAGSGGPAGDHKASALAPSATWQVGGSSGDFGWSYPMEVPPSTGGPQIEMSLDYSSGSVDGRTSATNNQPSWAGEGFEFAPGGSIERRYAGCSSKSEQNGNNGTRTVGDLCWATDNATFSLSGKGGELIRDDATGKWRPAADDGSTVERFTGAVNGDNDGEYWVITSEDGTKYYFGLNRLNGWATGHPETQSTWTVPVFGNNSGEPCHKSSFGDSHCQQAYKWNLDHVVDRHGNTMSFFYDVETNYYARNFSAGSVSKYVRAGNLKRIEYGQRDGEVYTKPAVARVVMTTADRCLPGTACTTNFPHIYPDTPLDQQCTSSSNCDNKFSPTFWTQKRLAKITTEVWRGTQFTPVDSWTLRHAFPDPGDGTRAGMWLEGLTNAGLVNGTVTAPELNFDGVQLPNRVKGDDNLPVMNWWRISAIHYGTGGELAVGYSPQDCSLPGNVPAPDTNGKRCHPAKWTPENQSERQDWFNKFVVTTVSEADRVSGLEPVVTKIDYLTPPAWRHDDEDGLVEIGKKTWSQWRGYERVRVTKGHPSGTQSITENRFFRGMDGDKLANGTTKDVHVTDSTGGRVEDVNPLAGQLREQLTYNGTTLVDRTINEQWISAPRATRVKPWGTTQSFQVEDAGIRQEELAGSQSRKRSESNTYTAAGVVTQKNDLNDLADPADDTCTRYTYTQNPAAGLRELPIREQTVTRACDQPWSNADVITDKRTEYDGTTGAPTKGDVTKVEQLSGFDGAGAPVYKTVTSVTYDVLGRPVTATNADGKTSTRVFTPAAGGPVTKSVVIASNGHAETTEWEPAWGEEVSITSPDGRRSEKAYDPMGRAEKVWLPGRPRGEQPNYSYEYLMRADGANAVRTTTLQANGNSETTIELTDGLLRKRQTQEPAPGGGRRVTDFVYDSRGELVKENGPYYNSAPPGDQVLIPVESELPLQKVTTFDGAERPTAQIVKSRDAEKWRTTYTHGIGSYAIQPPDGEQPVTRVMDVEGRLTELRQYTAEAGGPYDSTKYTYHRGGQLASVQDPAGNRWTFEYDLRGRKIRETDPDKGTTTATYDDLGRLTTRTDAHGRTLAFAYDDLGRRTAQHDGSLQGPKRTEWTYDTLSKGALTSATRFVDGQAYTTKVTGYDAGGRALGVEVVLPEREGALAGTYSVSNTYNADGEIATTQLPGVGDLPAETLQFGYNGQDLPTTLTGATSYVTGTAYTPYGEVQALTLAQSGGKWVQRLYEYESGTRRLSRVVTERETLPRRISSLSYSYDPAGNVKQITDAPSATSGEPTDTQCFAYDHLRRLTDAWTPASNNCAAAPVATGLGGPAPYWHSWTFDKVGNRLTETKHAAAGSITSNYEYPAAGGPHPHAVQKVTTTGPTGTKVDNYSYDETGNLTSRNLAGTTEKFTWDVEGELESVVKGSQTTSFVHDADGNRLLRRDSSGTTFYFGQTELLLKPSGEVTGTRYYQHANRTIAVRVGAKVTWLGTDHHGTPNLAIDAGNQSFERRRTTPYGGLRGPAPANWPGQKGFVGGPNDPSTGLVHLQARDYDPTTGRFISVDPVADYEDAQQLNGYAYANNSPATFTDPDGKLAFIPVIIIGVRLFPLVVRLIQAIPQIIRTVVPVIRTVVGHVVNGLGRLVEQVRRFTDFVVRTRTQIKRVTKVVRKVQRVTTTRIQRVPAGKPGESAKKPPSAGKEAGKSAGRNTTPGGQRNKRPNPSHGPKKPKGPAQSDRRGRQPEEGEKLYRGARPASDPHRTCDWERTTT